MVLLAKCDRRLIRHFAKDEPSLVTKRSVLQTRVGGKKFMVCPRNPNPTGMKVTRHRKERFCEYRVYNDEIERKSGEYIFFVEF